jgi:hypothetical protein
MIEQVIRSYMSAKGVDLPSDPRYTLAQADPAGRLDVAASSALAMSAAANPITNALFNVFRPVIDGSLTAHLGPSRIEPLLDEHVPAEMKLAYKALLRGQQ